jgi:hypothetical protein
MDSYQELKPSLKIKRIKNSFLPSKSSKTTNNLKKQKSPLQNLLSTAFSAVKICPKSFRFD